jgi:ABC-type lipoprotein release transport system permease subunit
MLLWLVQISWSNLWRNPRRTAITVAGLALGTVMLAFVLSMMAGMTRDLIKQGTGLLLGHVQIHHADYRPDRSIFDVVSDGRELARRLADDGEIVGAAPRVSTYGLVSSGNHSAGVELLGIDPSREASVSELATKLVTGTNVNGTADKGVLVGDRLARTLAIGPGDELVALTQAMDGSLGNDLYTVSGVFRTGIPMVDGGLLVMHLDDAQELLALEPEQVHEIALRTTSPTAATAVAERLAAELEEPGLEVAAWPALAPELGGWVALSDGWQWIAYSIIFALAAIAVLNTMLMAVFERLREFGVLTALGMRPIHIITMIIAEVAGLAVVSLVAAIALGAPLMRWFINDGIDLSRLTDGFTMSGVAFGPIMRGAWDASAYLRAAVLLIAFAMLAGLYPALRASRVDPAALTRGELR